MSTATALEIPRPGGEEMTQRNEKWEPKWKAIGVLYSRTEGKLTEFRVLYEDHVPDDVKTAIAERFGAGAIAWKEK